MKQAIVTGGTGFIGTFLVRELLEKNIPTIVLSRKSIHELEPRKRDILKNNICYFLELGMEQINLLPEKIKEKNIEISDQCVFFNLAWGTAKNLSDLDIGGQLANVQWSLNAYNSALKLKCNKFIHVGTMEEGFTKKYLELDYRKDDKYNRHIIYSLAKIASKDCLKLNYDIEHKIELIFVNNSHVMGPLDNKDSFLQVTLGKLLSKDELIFSTGEQFFDCISVYDVARAYFNVAQKGHNGKEYWIGSGEARKLKEYVKIMYDLYPSGMDLKFGHYKYNDISLTKEDFSIEELTVDTDFKPLNTFEDTVTNLAEFLQFNKINLI